MKLSMTKFSDDTITGRARNKEKLFVSHSNLDADRMDCKNCSLYGKNENLQKCKEISCSANTLNIQY